VDFDDSYVVRIFRRGTRATSAKNNKESLNGVIEAVGSGERTPFRGIEELWAALQRKPAKPVARRGRPE